MKKTQRLEMIIIGNMIVDNRRIDDIAGAIVDMEVDLSMLEEKNFHLLTAIIKLRNDRGPEMDLITISNFLHENDLYQKAGGLAHAVRCVESCDMKQQGGQLVATLKSWQLQEEIQVVTDVDCRERGGGLIWMDCVDRTKSMKWYEIGLVVLIVLCCVLAAFAL